MCINHHQILQSFHSIGIRSSSPLKVLLLQTCLVAFSPMILCHKSCIIPKTIFHLSVKKSLHEITLITKQAGMILLLGFCTKFNVQQTELSATSKKYWCFYNLRGKTRTTEFNWLADEETSHEGQLQLSFTSLLSAPSQSPLSVCCKQFRNGLLYTLMCYLQWKLHVCSIGIWRFIVMVHRSQSLKMNYTKTNRGVKLKLLNRL